MMIDEEIFYEDEEVFEMDKCNEAIECFANLPENLQFDSNPLAMQNIANHQLSDAYLQQQVQTNPIQFPVNIVQGIPVATIQGTNPDAPTQWKIYLPETLIQEVIKWFHETLGHAGVDVVYNTIKARFYCPKLYTHCQRFVCNINCTQYKNQGRGYGHLPPRNATATPWDEVAVNLIGPWQIDNPNDPAKPFEFKALTCIDPVTNLVEIVRIQNKTSRHVSQMFENTWLSRYP